MAVTYEFFYFELEGVARVCRLLLDLSGAKWTDKYAKVGITTICNSRTLDKLSYPL